MTTTFAASGIHFASPGTPYEWTAWAPFCLPMPMVQSFARPLSIGALKSVCGLTRLTTMTPSAASAVSAT